MHGNSCLTLEMHFGGSSIQSSTLHCTCMPSPVGIVECDLPVALGHVGQASLVARRVEKRWMDLLILVLRACLLIDGCCSRVVVDGRNTVENIHLKHSSI